jgi:hypothetical protein
MNKLYVFPDGLVSSSASPVSDDCFVVTPETTLAELLDITLGCPVLIIDIMTQLEMMG